MIKKSFSSSGRNSKTSAHSLTKSEHESFSKSPFSSDIEIHEGPMDIQWQNLNVFYHRRKYKTFWKSQILHIIKNVTGRLDHGFLMAIMGPSGCGKSTLLNCLTGRNLKGLYVQGKVFLNGQKASPARLADVSAYVQQNDIFIGVLTVEEHLIYQARLKMGHYLPFARIKKRVDEVLNELGLQGCRKTQIGTEKKSKISGGQKKRLSFASEILTNPPLLFADEPTSGLDSVMAHSVIQLCHSLAHKQRTVMVTIHQPSSEVFALFDYILLLTDGRLAFMGTVKEAIEYYASLKPPIICPINYSIPEFLLSKVCIRSGDEEESAHQVDKICQTFMESSYGAKLLKASNDLTIKRSTQASLSKRSFHRRRNELAILFDRCFVIFIRENSITSPTPVYCFLIAVAIGIVYYNLSFDQIGIMNITGGIFIVLTFVSITPVVDVVYVFVQELQVTIREYDSGLYSLIVYFFCKTLAAIPFRIMLPTTFVTITYYMMGLIRDFQRFGLSLLCLIIIYYVATGFGYFISTITPSLNDALLLAPALSIPLVMFAGLPIHLNSINIYLKWMRYLSWPFYGFEILTVLQWKNVTNITCPLLKPSFYQNLVNSSGPPVIDCVVQGDRIIERFALNHENLPFDFGMLCLMIIVFHLLALLGLYIRCSFD